jgi:hypothetical protein
MVVEDGLDYAGIGGLMATAMKYRGFAGAVIDASGECQDFCVWGVVELLSSSIFLPKR